MVHKQNIIVSVTSFPKRINKIHETLKSIFRQSVKADKIILYLSQEEFKNLSVDWSQFALYEEYNFSIEWVSDNLKPHKKYFYAFQEYSDDIVITIDDDMIYPPNMIEELLKCNEKYPDAVIARRTHLITRNLDDTIAPYDKWYGCCQEYVDEPRMDLMATGCGAVLYPSVFMKKDIFDIEKIKNTCLCADDLWLKVMEMKYGIPTVLCDTIYAYPASNDITDGGLFYSVNNEGGNDRQLKDILSCYINDVNINECIKSMYCVGEALVLKKEFERKKYDENIIAFLDNILNKKIAVYGAGKIAHKMLHVIKEIGKIDSISYIIVKALENNPTEIYGIPVVDLSKNSYVGDVLVLNAKKYQKEIYSDLKKHGFLANQIIMLTDAQIWCLNNCVGSI